jgi:polyisoprenoid-binding protein YceI
MAKCIGVRFINSEGEPTSRQYTYSTDLDVELNSLLKVNANGKTSCVLVTNTEIDPRQFGFSD